MKYRQLSRFGVRRFAAVFEIGDDALDALQEFCESEGVHSAALTGLGGFSSARLGYYDMDVKQYMPIDVNEQVEVLSFIGNVTQYQGKPKIHVHCVVGHRDGRTTGGHLLGGTVCPTLELQIEELPSMVERTDRPEIGIPLIEL